MKKKSQNPLLNRLYPNRHKNQHELQKKKCSGAKEEETRVSLLPHRPEQQRTTSPRDVDRRKASAPKNQHHAHRLKNNHISTRRDNSRTVVEKQDPLSSSFTESIHERVANLKPGADVVLARDSFLYLVPEDRENPYNLTIVSTQELVEIKKFEKSSRDYRVYYTMSKSGLTCVPLFNPRESGEIMDETSSEFIPLHVFEREYRLYHCIRRIPFFCSYRAWKALQLWKRNVRFRKMKLAQLVLLREWIPFQDRLCGPIFQLIKLCVDVCHPSSSLYLCGTQEEAQSMASFQLKQSEHRVHMTTILSEFQHQLTRLTFQACEDYLAHYLAREGFHQDDAQADAQEERNPSPQRGPDSDSVTFTERAAIRTQCRKLVKFIRVVDYLSLETLLELGISSVTQFCTSMVHEVNLRSSLASEEASSLPPLFTIGIHFVQEHRTTMLRDEERPGSSQECSMIELQPHGQAFLQELHDMILLGIHLITTQRCPLLRQEPFQLYVAALDNDHNNNNNNSSRMNDSNGTSKLVNIEMMIANHPEFQHQIKMLSQAILGVFHACELATTQYHAFVSAYQANVVFLAQCQSSLNILPYQSVEILDSDVSNPSNSKPRHVLPLPASLMKEQLSGNLIPNPNPNEQVVEYFQRLLQFYQTQVERFNTTLSPVLHLNIVECHAEALVETLRASPHTCLKTLHDLLPQVITDWNEHLFVRFRAFQDTLGTENLTSVSAFVSLCQTKANYEDQSPDLDAEFDVLKQLYGLIEEFDGLELGDVGKSNALMLRQTRAAVLKSIAVMNDAQQIQMERWLDRFAGLFREALGRWLEQVSGFVEALNSPLCQTRVCEEGHRRFEVDVDLLLSVLNFVTNELEPAFHTCWAEFELLQHQEPFVVLDARQHVLAGSSTSESTTTSSATVAQTFAIECVPKFNALKALWMHLHKMYQLYETKWQNQYLFRKANCAFFQDFRESELRACQDLLEKYASSSWTKHVAYRQIHAWWSSLVECCDFFEHFHRSLFPMLDDESATISSAVHWQALVQFFHCQTLEELQHLTLQDWVEKHQLNFRSEISRFQQLVYHTQLDMRMEHQFQSCIQFWKTFELEFTTMTSSSSVRDSKGRTCVGPMDSHFAQLEDALVTLTYYQGYLGGSGSGVGSSITDHSNDDDSTTTTTEAQSSPLLALVVEWTLKLQHLRHFLQTLVHIQTQWTYWNTLFEKGTTTTNTNDFSKQFPKEMKHYQQFEANFEGLVNECQEIQLACDVIDQRGSEFLLQLAEYQRTCDELHQALSSYVELKCSVFPRFYFLAREEILTLLWSTSGCQSVQVAKCFTGIKSIQVEDDSSMIEITGVENYAHEALVFQKMIRSRTGQIEEWFFPLDIQIKQALKVKMKQATVEMFNLNTGSDIDPGSDMSFLRGWITSCFDQDIPTQCILVVYQMIRSHAAGSSKTGSKNIIEWIQKWRDEMDVKKATQSSSHHHRQRALVDAILMWELYLCDLDMTPNNDTQPPPSSSIPFHYEWNVTKEEMEIQSSGWITSRVHSYEYEFQGTCPRLILTPRTVRCFWTIYHALSLSFGLITKVNAVGSPHLWKDLALGFGAAPPLQLVFGSSHSYVRLRPVLTGIRRMNRWLDIQWTGTSGQAQNHGPQNEQWYWFCQQLESVQHHFRLQSSSKHDDSSSSLLATTDKGMILNDDDCWYPNISYPESSHHHFTSSASLPSIRSSGLFVLVRTNLNFVDQASSSALTSWKPYFRPLQIVRPDINIYIRYCLILGGWMDDGSSAVLKNTTTSILECLTYGSQLFPALRQTLFRFSTVESILTVASQYWTKATNKMKMVDDESPQSQEELAIEEQKRKSLAIGMYETLVILCKKHKCGYGEELYKLTIFREWVQQQCKLEIFEMPHLEEEHQIEIENMEIEMEMNIRTQLGNSVWKEKLYQMMDIVHQMSDPVELQDQTRSSNIGWSGMIVHGPIQSGKSSAITALSTIMKKKKGKQLKIYPNAMTLDELFGTFVISKRDHRNPVWKDGLVSQWIRQLSSTSPIDDPDTRSWIIWDGPVVSRSSHRSTSWIEHLLGCWALCPVSGNAIFRGLNGEQCAFTSVVESSSSSSKPLLPLKPFLLFEMLHLTHASPALLSGAASVEFSSQTVRTWQSIVTCWMSSMARHYESQVLAQLKLLFDQFFIDEVFDLVDHSNSTVAPAHAKAKVVTMCCQLLEGLVTKMTNFQNYEDNCGADDSRNHSRTIRTTHEANFVQGLFLFAMSWSFGGQLRHREKQNELSQILNDLCLEHQLVSYSAKYMSTVVSRGSSSSNILTLFDFGIDWTTFSFLLWPEFHARTDQHIISRRDNELLPLFLWTASGIQALEIIRTVTQDASMSLVLQGDIGSGKTTLVNQLNNHQSSSSPSWVRISGKWNLSSHELQSSFSTWYDKQSEASLGNGNWIAFVEDVHLIQSVQPFEWLRQMKDQNGMWIHHHHSSSTNDLETPQALEPRMIWRWKNLSPQHAETPVRLKFILTRITCNNNEFEQPSSHFTHNCFSYTVLPTTQDYQHVMQHHIEGGGGGIFTSSSHVQQDLEAQCLQSLPQLLVTHSWHLFQHIHREFAYRPSVLSWTRPPTRPSHYQWNFHHLLQVLEVGPEGSQPTLEGRVLSFIDQCYRVFYDRLVSREDQDHFTTLLHQHVVELSNAFIGAHSTQTAAVKTLTSTWNTMDFVTQFCRRGTSFSGPLKHSYTWLNGFREAVHYVHQLSRRIIASPPRSSHGLLIIEPRSTSHNILWSPSDCILTSMALALDHLNHVDHPKSKSKSKKETSIVEWTEDHHFHNHLAWRAELKDLLIQTGIYGHHVLTRLSLTKLISAWQTTTTHTHAHEERGEDIHDIIRDWNQFLTSGFLDDCFTVVEQEYYCKELQCQLSGGKTWEENKDSGSGQRPSRLIVPKQYNLLLMDSKTHSVSRSMICFWKQKWVERIQNHFHLIMHCQESEDDASEQNLPLSSFFTTFPSFLQHTTIQWIANTRSSLSQTSEFIHYILTHYSFNHSNKPTPKELVSISQWWSHIYHQEHHRKNSGKKNQTNQTSISELIQVLQCFCQEWSIQYQAYETQARKLNQGIVMLQMVATQQPKQHQESQRRNSKKTEDWWLKVCHQWQEEVLWCDECIQQCGGNVCFYIARLFYGLETMQSWTEFATECQLQFTPVYSKYVAYHTKRMSMDVAATIQKSTGHSIIPPSILFSNKASQLLEQLSHVYSLLSYNYEPLILPSSPVTDDDPPSGASFGNHPASVNDDSYTNDDDQMVSMSSPVDCIFLMDSFQLVKHWIECQYLSPRQQQQHHRRVSSSSSPLLFHISCRTIFSFASFIDTIQEHVRTLDDSTSSEQTKRKVVWFVEHIEFLTPFIRSCAKNIDTKVQKQCWNDLLLNLTRDKGGSYISTWVFHSTQQTMTSKDLGTLENFFHWKVMSGKDVSSGSFYSSAELDMLFQHQLTMRMGDSSKCEEDESSSFLGGQTTTKNRGSVMGNKKYNHRNLMKKKQSASQGKHNSTRSIRMNFFHHHVQEDSEQQEEGEGENTVPVVASSWLSQDQQTQFRNWIQQQQLLEWINAQDVDVLDLKNRLELDGGDAAAAAKKESMIEAFYLEKHQEIQMDNQFQSKSRLAVVPKQQLYQTLAQRGSILYRSYCQQLDSLPTYSCEWFQQFYYHIMAKLLKNTPAFNDQRQCVEKCVEEWTLACLQLISSSFHSLNDQMLYYYGIAMELVDPEKKKGHLSWKDRCDFMVSVFQTHWSLPFINTVVRCSFSKQKARVLLPDVFGTTETSRRHVLLCPTIFRIPSQDHRGCPVYGESMAPIFLLQQFAHEEYMRHAVVPSREDYENHEKEDEEMHNHQQQCRPEIQSWSLSSPTSEHLHQFQQWFISHSRRSLSPNKPVAETGLKQRRPCWLWIENFHYLMSNVRALEQFLQHLSGLSASAANASTNIQLSFRWFVSLQQIKTTKDVLQPPMNRWLSYIFPTAVYVSTNMPLFHNNLQPPTTTNTMDTTTTTQGMNILRKCHQHLSVYKKVRSSTCGTFFPTAAAELHWIWTYAQYSLQHWNSCRISASQLCCLLYEGWIRNEQDFQSLQLWLSQLSLDDKLAPASSMSVIMKDWMSPLVLLNGNNDDFSTRSKDSVHGNDDQLQLSRSSDVQVNDVSNVQEEAISDWYSCVSEIPELIIFPDRRQLPSNTDSTRRLLEAVLRHEIECWNHFVGDIIKPSVEHLNLYVLTRDEENHRPSDERMIRRSYNNYCNTCTTHHSKIFDVDWFQELVQDLAQNRVPKVWIDHVPASALAVFHQEPMMTVHGFIQEVERWLQTVQAWIDQQEFPSESQTSSRSTTTIPRTKIWSNTIVVQLLYCPTSYFHFILHAFAQAQGVGLEQVEFHMRSLTKAPDVDRDLDDPIKYRIYLDEIVLQGAQWKEATQQARIAVEHDDDRQPLALIYLEPVLKRNNDDHSSSAISCPLYFRSTRRSTHSNSTAAEYSDRNNRLEFPDHQVVQWISLSLQEISTDSKTSIIEPSSPPRFTTNVALIHLP